MSEPVNEPVEDESTDDTFYASGSGGRRKKGRGIAGCLPLLLILALIGGGLYFGITKGVDFLQDQFSDAEDFPGPGKGKVTFEVQSGDTATDIGRNLKDQDVVASVDAFVSAAQGDSKSGGIQVGFYTLKKEMKAKDALAILIDPGNLVANSITFPEGLTVQQTLDILVDKTDFKRKDFRAVLDDPGTLGLPDYAKGNPEGYLFPSTYSFGPKETPESMLRAMVRRWEQAAKDADLEGAAKRLGYTEAELMTIASLTEAEARPDDMAKVARVIYNRLENEGTAGTVGLLQIDATVNFALGRNLGVALTTEDKEVDSPYNTHLYKGLPPGPIEAPGDAALQAAANPADGDWYYYVTVDLKTGETKFAENYDEFLEYKQEFITYCETSDAC